RALDAASNRPIAIAVFINTLHPREGSEQRLRRRCLCRPGVCLNPARESRSPALHDCASYAGPRRASTHSRFFYHLFVISITTYGNLHDLSAEPADAQFDAAHAPLARAQGFRMRGVARRRL